LSELTNRVDERITKSISQITCIVINEISVSSIKVVSLVCLGDLNQKSRGLNSDNWGCFNSKLILAP